jgi:hypothetical protein
MNLWNFNGLFLVTMESSARLHADAPEFNPNQPAWAARETEKVPLGEDLGQLGGYFSSVRCKWDVNGMNYDVYVILCNNLNN